MAKLLRVLGWTVGGFVLGAVLASALVAMGSTNAHDKSLEVAMTAFFFGGPIGAVLGLIFGIARASGRI